MATKIEWVKSTDGRKGETWNPITGCTKFSPGCKNCYAERMAVRQRHMGNPNYRDATKGEHWTGKMTLAESVLEKPLHWRKPRMIFVNSMTDLFHGDVHEEWLERLFAVIRKCPQHTFQILTKRAKTMQMYMAMVSAQGKDLYPLPNVWVGVSVESAKYMDRIAYLRQTRAAVRFISFEPLLGPIPPFDLDGIGWVIAGCESGPGRRPADAEWFADICQRCIRAGVPFFLKQMERDGKVNKMPVLFGVPWAQMPEVKQ